MIMLKKCLYYLMILISIKKLISAKRWKNCVTLSVIQKTEIKKSLSLYKITYLCTYLFIPFHKAPKVSNYFCFPSIQFLSISIKREFSLPLMILLSRFQIPLRIVCHRLKNFLCTTNLHNAPDMKARILL